MDIAIALSLAVTERTLQAVMERSEQGKAYAAYPLRGGCELWSVRLGSETVKPATPSNCNVAVDSFCLSWQGKPATASAAVNLIPSGQSRLRRALNNVCGGFELSFSKPAAWAASGVLSCALAWLAGTTPVTATTAMPLPANTSRSVQCCSSMLAEDGLLANISQPARHRVFSRARDSVYGKGGSGGSGINNHTNTIKTYTDGGYIDSTSGEGSSIGGHGKNEQGHANIVFGKDGQIIRADGSDNGHVNVNPSHSNGQGPEGGHKNLTPGEGGYNPIHVNLASDPNRPEIVYHSNNGHGNVGRK